MNKLPKFQSLQIETHDMNFFEQLYTVLTHVDKVKLTEDWYYKLPNDKTICIPKGFIFDGNSIPRIFWILFKPFNSYMLAQGVIHDYGYRYNYLWALDRFGNFYKYKKEAGQLEFDKIYYDVGMQTNGFKLTNKINKLVLNLFGFVAWRKNRRKNAPELKPYSALARR